MFFLLFPHLCPSVVPRFVDDHGNLLRCPLRHLDFRYRAAAYLGGGAAEEGPLELDGLAMRPAAESRYVITARVLGCHEVVPACVFVLLMFGRECWSVELGP